MRYKSIRIVVRNRDENVEDNRDFDTVKEAKAWVKECGLERGYWVRLAESESYPDNIYVLQLVCDGEILKDWFPGFAPEPVITTTDCSDCDGYGAFSRDYSRSVHPSDPGSHTCSRCHGTGEVVVAAAREEVAK